MIGRGHVPELVHERNLALDVGIRYLKVSHGKVADVRAAHLEDLLTGEQVPLLAYTSLVEVVQRAGGREVDEGVANLESVAVGTPGTQRCNDC